MKKLLLLEKKDRSETEEISNIGNTLGLNVIVKDLNDFHFDLESLASLEEKIKKYDGLWVRTYSDFSLVRILCSLFEKSYKPVFGANSQDSSFIQDKMADLWQLKIHNVPIPHTSKNIASINNNVIYKPYWGFGGFDIHKEDPKKPYYYQQELIDKTSDIRLYISNYKVIPLIIERSNQCDFRTNKHQGGSAEIFSLFDYSTKESLNIVKQICVISELAARSLNRPFSAIDLIKNGEQYQVLEVNRTPRIRLNPYANHIIIETMLKDIIAVINKNY